MGTYLKKNSLLKNSVFNVLYRISSLIFPLIYSAYVARIIFADGVGRVEYANNVISYFIMFAVFGLPAYGTREIAKRKSNQTDLNKIFTELFIVNFISTTFAIFIFIIFLLFNDRIYVNRYLFLCCSIPLFLNFINIDWFYAGEEEFAYIAYRSIVVKILMTFTIFVFVRKTEDYKVYALISGIATAGNYIFNIIHVRKFVQFDFKNIKLKSHFKSASIFFFGEILSQLYSKVDILMLGLFCTASSIGYYVYGNKIAVIIIFICTSFASAFLPRLSYYYENDRNKFLNLVNLGIKVLLFLSIPLSVGLFLLSKDFVVLLYGEGFYSSTSVIRLLTPMIIIRALGDLLCYQCVLSTGYEKIRIPATIMAGITNILLNAILIPKFTHNGAAFASVIAEFVVNAIQFIYIKERLKFSISLRSLLQAVITSVLMGIVVYICLSFPLPLFSSIVMSIFSGSFVYFMVNLAIKNEVSLLIVTKVKKGLFR